MRIGGALSDGRSEAILTGYIPDVYTSGFGINVKSGDSLTGFAAVLHGKEGSANEIMEEKSFKFADGCYAAYLRGVPGAGGEL